MKSDVTTFLTKTPDTVFRFLLAGGLAFLWAVILFAHLELWAAMGAWLCVLGLVRVRDTVKARLDRSRDDDQITKVGEP